MPNTAGSEKGADWLENTSLLRTRDIGGAIMNAEIEKEGANGTSTLGNNGFASNNGNYCSKNSSWVTIRNGQSRKAPSIASSKKSVRSEKAWAKDMYVRQVTEVEDKIREMGKLTAMSQCNIKKKLLQVARLKKKTDSSRAECNAQNLPELHKEIEKLEAELEEMQVVRETAEIEAQSEIARLRGGMAILKHDYEARIVDLEDVCGRNASVHDLPPEDDDVLKSKEYSVTSKFRGENSMSRALEQIGEALKILGSSQSNASNKFIARQALGNGVPSFDEQTESRPAFHSAFENSTNNCGYLDKDQAEQNLNAIKGLDFRTVQGLFRYPRALKPKMKVWEEKCGPLKLISRLRNHKTEDYPPVKEEKPESTINFEEAVGNLVATTQKLGQQSYLDDPILVDELVGELPNTINKNWGRELLNGKQDTINDFIQVEKTMACMQTVPEAEAETYNGLENELKYHAKAEFSEQKSQAEEWKGKIKGSDIPAEADLLDVQEQKLSSCVVPWKDVHLSSQFKAAETIIDVKKAEPINKNRCWFICSTLPAIEKPKMNPAESLAMTDESKFDHQKIYIGEWLSANGLREIKLTIVFAQQNGINGASTVKVLFDRGSQANLAEERVTHGDRCYLIREGILGYEQLNGSIDDCFQSYYEIKLECLDKSFKTIIVVCAGIEVCSVSDPQIENGPWMSEIKKKGLMLSGNETYKVSEIQVIIGKADAALMEVLHIFLDSGLFSIKKFELMLSGHDSKKSNMIVGSLCSGSGQELPILKSIVLDIMEEKTLTKEIEKRRTICMENTEKVAARKEISLLWINKNGFSPDNLVSSKTRFQFTNRNLLKHGSYRDFSQVLAEWWKEGFMEERIECSSIVTQYYVFELEDSVDPPSRSYNPHQQAAMSWWEQLGMMSWQEQLATVSWWKGPKWLKLPLKDWHHDQEVPAAKFQEVYVLNNFNMLREYNYVLIQLKQVVKMHFIIRNLRLMVFEAREHNFMKLLVDLKKMKLQLLSAYNENQ